MSNTLIREAITILNDSDNMKIDFHIRSVHITGHLLRRVAAAIGPNPPQHKRIRVAYIPELLGSDTFNYNVYTNTLELFTDTLVNNDYKALFIHEAVHAGCDLMGATRMRTVSSEAAGYIAECIWYITKGLNVSTSGDQPTDAIFSEAFRLANRIIRTEPLHDSDFDLLRTTIGSHPKYIPYPEIVGYNGVPNSRRHRRGVN